MIFGTSDTNEATLVTHVNSCAGMNVGNIKLNQWIITTNTDIVDRYIQFDDDNPFDPICLNCALDKEEENLTGTLTSLVIYITCYKDATTITVIISFIIGKNVAENTIIRKLIF